MGCVCLDCDSTGQRFARWFGFNPVINQRPRVVRSHEEVVIGKRNRAEAVAKRRKFYARRKAERALKQR